MNLKIRKHTLKITPLFSPLTHTMDEHKFYLKENGEERGGGRGEHATVTWLPSYTAMDPANTFQMGVSVRNSRKKMSKDYLHLSHFHSKRSNSLNKFTYSSNKHYFGRKESHIYWSCHVQALSHMLHFFMLTTNLRSRYHSRFLSFEGLTKGVLMICQKPQEYRTCHFSKVFTWSWCSLGGWSSGKGINQWVRWDCWQTPLFHSSWLSSPLFPICWSSPEVFSRIPAFKDLMSEDHPLCISRV